jgi:hypothetical protein
MNRQFGDRSRQGSATAWSRRPEVWLWVVTLSYSAAQLIVMDANRFLDWDEAVYVSEASRFAESSGLGAHRALGVVYLIWPLVQVTESLLALRLYLLAASTVCFWVAHRVWVWSIGWASVLGAGLLGCSWLALFYGSEAAPNLFSALGAMTAVGLVAAMLVGREPKWVYPLLGITVGMVALLRPVDAAALMVSTSLIAVAYLRDRVPKILMTTIAGLAIGMLPWLVDSFAEYGGPVAQLRLASHIVGGGLTNNGLELLRLLDGPLVGPQGDLSLPLLASLWLAALFAFALLGALTAKGNSFRVAVAVLISSVIAALPYVFGAEALAPRFLLPALALLTTAAGIGALTLMRRTHGWPFPVAVAAILVTVSIWNGPTATALEAEQTELRAHSLALGVTLSERMRNDCYFLSQYGFPQIAYASGCAGDRLVYADNRQLSILGRFELLKARWRGQQIATISLGEAPQGLDPLAWECSLLQLPPRHTWHICIQAS